MEEEQHVCSPELITIDTVRKPTSSKPQNFDVTLRQNRDRTQASLLTKGDNMGQHNLVTNAFQGHWGKILIKEPEPEPELAKEPDLSGSNHLKLEKTPTLTLP